MFINFAQNKTLNDLNYPLKESYPLTSPHYAQSLNLTLQCKKQSFILV